MTKIRILGETTPEQKELKPIEFISFIFGDGKIDTDVNSPNNWNNIELVCRNYNSLNLDLMFAYDDNERDDGALYLGHFNDGLV